MFIKSAKKKTDSVLKGFAKIRRFRVLSDIDLEFKGKLTHIDHLLIGFFGVLFVTSMDLKKGEVFGTERDETWTVVTKTDRFKVENPYQKNIDNNAFVRAIFAAESIYRVQIENAVVIDCADKNKQINAPVAALNIFTPKELKKYLRRVKFEKDTGIDVDKIADCLEKYKK